MATLSSARASAWHEAAGSAEEAVHHALAGDPARAVALIARYWHVYVDKGRTSTVRGWMRALGDDQIGAYPLAAHCAAWCGGSSPVTGDRYDAGCRSSSQPTMTGRFLDRHPVAEVLSCAAAG